MTKHRPTAYLPLSSQLSESCRECDEPWPCPTSRGLPTPAEQLAAVRRLHAMVSDESGHYCDSCLNSWGEPMRWPCPTIRTLDNLTAEVDCERLSLVGLRNLCDGVRARLMYDKSRDITVHEAHTWACLGWDVGHRDGAGLRHPSEAVAKVFPVLAWRPAMEEQAWFRYGFARQRAGSPRPIMRG